MEQVTFINIPNDLFILCQSPGGKPYNSSEFAELEEMLHFGIQGSWTTAEHSEDTVHLQFVSEQASKGMDSLSALDILRESIIGVFSKRTQTPGGPGEGEAKL